MSIIVKVKVTGDQHYTGFSLEPFNESKMLIIK